MKTIDLSEPEFKTQKIIWHDKSKSILPRIFFEEDSGVGLLKEVLNSLKIDQLVDVERGLNGVRELCIPYLKQKPKFTWFAEYDWGLLGEKEQI